MPFNDQNFDLFEIFLDFMIATKGEKFHPERVCSQVLENGFEKSKHFTTYWLKAFSSDTPQRIKRQNKGPKEHDEKYLPSCGSK